MCNYLSEVKTLVSIMKVSGLFLRRRWKFVVVFFGNPSVDISACLMGLPIGRDPFSYIFAS